MSEEKHELVIIRHRHNHEEAHHGGAWKIAFADFMTAMMALFLVLWLISTTTPKVKTSIARYFNPVKLVELTPLKKGFNDPVESEAVPGAEGKGPTPTDDKKQREKGPVSDGSENAMAGKASHSEAALFRDPYAVLAEIVSTDQAKTEAQRPTELTEASVDAPEPFRDPFATIPAPTPAERVEGIKVRETPSQLKSTPTETSTPSEPAQPRLGKADAAPPATKGNGAKRADAKATDDKPSEVQAAARNAQAQSAAAAAQPAPTPAASSDVTRLQTELVQAIAKGSDGKAVPQVEVRGTDEGLLISLTDEQTYSMFSVGSAEPQAKTIHAMEAVAQQLKNRVGQIIIRGFTDGRPYKSPTYDNWRLSSARAHMAQYMLIRGGLDEKRVAAIEGLADRRPKNPSDPLAPENRRIEILLRTEKPK